jgi:Flp pilus assembly pilin Flp
MFLKRWRARGQATTEYILVVVLVAVLSIGIITTFGNQVRDLFRVAIERISGGTGTLDPSIPAKAPSEVKLGLPDLKNGGSN